MLTRTLLGIGIAVVALAVALAVGVGLARGPGKDKGKPPAGGDKVVKEDPNDLSLEVAALQTLRSLKLTPAQLDALAELARDASLKDDRKRDPAKASDEYRKALADLRDALARGDEDKLDERTKAADDALSDDDDLDDAVEPTAAARKRAPEFLRRLTARQVASYLADHRDDPADPLETLTAALDDARKLTGNEWDEKRDATVGALSWLVAGADAEAADRVGGQVRELLDRAHRLKGEEFKAQRDDLADEAKRIVGDGGPVEVIRHYTEWGLAELLSNPRLAAAVEVRRAAGK
jgi:hypothetical protein